jgi:hypothetical protein
LKRLVSEGAGSKLAGPSFLVLFGFGRPIHRRYMPCQWRLYVLAVDFTAGITLPLIESGTHPARFLALGNKCNLTVQGPEWPNGYGYRC